MGLTHIDDHGDAVMVDISNKPEQKRTARAQAIVHMNEETVRLLQAGLLKKGNALAVGRIAGIQAAKMTAQLIPLCHNIRIDGVGVDFEIRKDSIVVTTTATCRAATGIEMEALTAASMASLAIYDMCKAVDKTMRITDIVLLSKTKGEA